jgi:hypothetical protein
VNGIKREEKEVVGVRYAGEKRVGGGGGRVEAARSQGATKLLVGAGGFRLVKCVGKV